MFSGSYNYGLCCPISGSINFILPRPEHQSRVNFKLTGKKKRFPLPLKRMPSVDWLSCSHLALIRCRASLLCASSRSFSSRSSRASYSSSVSVVMSGLSSLWDFFGRIERRLEFGLVDRDRVESFCWVASLERGLLALLPATRIRMHLYMRRGATYEAQVHHSLR